jgi:hypothetical protein
MTPSNFGQAISALQAVSDHLQPDPWNKWLAIGTFLTFAATAVMAWKTWQLAKETVDGTVIADIHHQESQSGLVIWTGKRIVEFVQDSVIIRGYLINVGPGAATTVAINLTGTNPPINLGVFVDSLATGAEFPKNRQDENTPMWVFPLGHGAAARAQLLEQDPSFRVSYSTIYDRQRVTTYPVGGRTNDAAGARLQYIQEFINLNRDERISSISAIKRSPRERIVGLARAAWVRVLTVAGAVWTVIVKIARAAWARIS